MISSRFSPTLFFISFTLMLSAVADEVVPRPASFEDEKHEQIYDQYQEALTKADDQKTSALGSLDNAFERTLQWEHLGIAHGTSARQMKELRKITSGWQKNGGWSIDGPIPAGLKTIVAGYQSTESQIERRYQEARLAASDRLIAKLDAHAITFEKLPDGRKTTALLRAQLRKAMLRGGPTVKHGDLEVVTRRWKMGDPWCTRTTPEKRALITLSRVQGHFAGGGEHVWIGFWDDGDSLCVLANSMQPSMSVNSLTLRHPQLDLENWKIHLKDINHDKPKLKLIHRSRGFAYLGGIEGSHGGTSHADVRLNANDGHYYATLDTNSRSIGARAVVVEFPKGEQPPFEFESVEWKSGDECVETIDATEGICLLSGISGPLRGTEEEVWMNLGADGKWRLGGRSRFKTTAIRALVLRFKK